MTSSAILAAGSAETAAAFLEVGAVVFGLGILSRVAGRLGVTAVPFYLIAGLAFGRGGLAELDVSEDFVSLAAEIGVLLEVEGLIENPAERKPIERSEEHLGRHR